MRIASFLPSGTELVVALGAGGALVARSHECDFPPWVAALPIVSRPTFDIHANSAQIDQQVRARLSAGAPLYEIDEPLLATLAPDVVITQTHCEVCAVSPRAIGAEYKRTQVSCLVAGDIAGILAGYRLVADAIGRQPECERLIEGIQNKIHAAQESCTSLVRPKVVVVEWLDPVFVSGNWVPELVHIAGGCEVLGQAQSRSTVMKWDDVCAADPDVLIVAPCGFDMARTRSELSSLTARPGFADLRAVRSNRCFVADGNLYFNRSGPNLFETLQVLQQILHPKTFVPSMRGQAWDALVA